MDIEFDNLLGHMINSDSRFDNLQAQLFSLKSRAMEVIKLLTTEFDIKFNPLKGLPQKKKAIYKCRFCAKQFQSPCSVGGHVSQMHSAQAKNMPKMDKLGQVKAQYIQYSVYDRPE